MHKTTEITMNWAPAKRGLSEPRALAIDGGLAVGEPLRVCFVCAGNTCRSPMAAAVTNVLGAPYGIYAESAGLCAADGMPMAKSALAALYCAGFTPTEHNAFDRHSSRRLTEETVSRCDRVIAMEGRHLMSLLSEFPAFASRFYAMPEDIPDPYGGTPEEYRLCLDAITAGIKELFHFE